MRAATADLDVNGPGNQQAYDRGSTIFSPDGRLYQVEYAREAVSRGAPSVGVVTAESVVLAIDRGETSPLVEETSIEKLHKVDEHVGIASAGHVADGRHLIDFARRQAQVERLRYDQSISVESLTKTVTDHVQQYTQLGGARPFGVALLIGGVVDDEPQLFEVDPGGVPRAWNATAIGRDHRDLLDHLEEEWTPDLDHEEGVMLALAALGEVIGKPVAPNGIGVASISVPTNAYEVADGETVRSSLDELDLLQE